MLASFEPGSAYGFHQFSESKVLFEAVDQAKDRVERGLANQRLDQEITRTGRGIPLLRNRVSFAFNPERVASLGEQNNILSLDLSQIKMKL